jgi:hypothetical protein
MDATTVDPSPGWYGSLWVAQFESRQAVEDYQNPVPPDDPDDEPTCPFFEAVGLSADDFPYLEVRHEPDLWRKGADAFAGLSWGHLFGGGADRVVRTLGLTPFDTVLMVWGDLYQNYAEPGEARGPIRFVGTFDLTNEPSDTRESSG